MDFLTKLLILLSDQPFRLLLLPGAALAMLFMWWPYFLLRPMVLVLVRIAAPRVPKYWRGQASRLAIMNVGDILFSVFWPLPFVLISGFAAFFSLANLLHELKFAPLIGFLVSTAIFVLFTHLLVSWVRDSSTLDGRIVPYFKDKLGKRSADTYYQGEHLSRNCEFLDNLASEEGFSGLSDFGFNDDLYLERVIWHDPRKGIEAFDLMVKAIRARDIQEDRAAGMIGELIEIRETLVIAAEKETSFCLLAHAHLQEDKTGRIGFF